MKETIEVFREIVQPKVISGETYNTEALLSIKVADLKLDSLEMMELAMQLEDAFNVYLDEEELLQCDRFSDILRLIERST